jgi:glycerol-3-phosphate acyltransferase PlsY
MSVMFVEFLKAILPIWLAYQYFDISGYDLVLVSAMPILGHSFSPFLKFKGGKALAVTAAMWLALFNVESAIVIFGLLAIMYTIQKNDAWTVNLVHFGFFLYGMITNISNQYISNTQFMFLWIFASLMMIYNHKKELQSFPQFKKFRDLFGVKFD